jgi:hypothetical protein
MPPARSFSCLGLSSRSPSDSRDNEFSSCPCGAPGEKRHPKNDHRNGRKCQQVDHDLRIHLERKHAPEDREQHGRMDRQHSGVQPLGALNVGECFVVVGARAVDLLF